MLQYGLPEVRVCPVTSDCRNMRRYLNSIFNFFNVIVSYCLAFFCFQKTSNYNNSI
jgi:hypothetical protein